MTEPKEMQAEMRQLPLELPDYTNLSLTTGVERFMTIAGQSTTRFNAPQAMLYLGLQFEELAEKIDTIRKGTITNSAHEDLLSLSTYLQVWSKRFKGGAHQGDLMRAPRALLVDDDFDLAFVSVAALFSTSINARGVVLEGNRSNLAKFPDGVAVRDANGKVVKPAGWTPPDFERFVDTRDQEP